MATASIAAKGRIKDVVFEWEGKDKNGKSVRGEMRAGGEAMVSASLRRQGVMVSKVKKRRTSGQSAIKMGIGISALIGGYSSSALNQDSSCSRDSGSGTATAERVTGDNCVPKTVISVPGANVLHLPLLPRPVVVIEP